MWSLSAAAMVLGWIGAVCSLLAYWGVSTQRVAPDSLRYHALNMLACGLLAMACLATRAWPSVVTNLIFIVIGVRMTWRVRDRLTARIRTEFSVVRMRLGRAPRLRGARTSGGVEVAAGR
ncbi:MAG: hypothetical protein L0L69_04595 [Propionibacterium sp.]|nr:hypothetical protein [Propionibacterium sp.]MDN6565676.1 hypothetical protein [Actinomyces sp.]MDN6794329.1 hypothetical protein [Propionibacterium sp.]